MGQGRGSVTQTWSLGFGLMLCICLLNHINVVESTSYNVGDGGGWTFGVSNWPNGKSFNAGDVLVFKYTKGLHNVVVVDANGYKSCKAPSGSKVYDSGDDQITLNQGDSYFICSIPGHCDGGMKIAVHAA
ncbi:chemocyanin-like [Ananas comosus]|uniref:Plantacyanin n=1 Tax=Ananas comosus TaxID=4615 RepID=A0A6P5G664_ANACO|nr:chemocyanin-like [Ananas comosus]